MQWEAMEERGVCPLIRIYGYFKSMENLTEYSYQNNVSVIIFLAKNLAETFCEYVSNTSRNAFLVCDSVIPILQMKNESCNSNIDCSMNCSISSISELCLQANLFGKKIREYRIAMIGNVSIETKQLYEAYQTWLNQIPSSKYTDAVVTNVEKVLKDRIGFNCIYAQNFSCIVD